MRITQTAELFAALNLVDFAAERQQLVGVDLIFGIQLLRGESQAADGPVRGSLLLLGLVVWHLLHLRSEVLGCAVHTAQPVLFGQFLCKLSLLFIYPFFHLN